MPSSRDHETEIEVDLSRFGSDDDFDFLAETRDFINSLGSTSTSPTSTSGAATGAAEKPVAVIRTSDRIAYRRCRRKWNWAHSSRGNLRPAAESAPFWLGTGFHFGLEDFHGYRNFKHPRDALAAYAAATRKSGLTLPEDCNELLQLGQEMFDYYESWLESREPLETLWINGEPQVEVHFYVEIPKEDLLRAGCPQYVLDSYSRIVYSITIDRVIKDDYGRIWTVEYKSARQFAWMHLDTDPQVTAYAWGARIKYPDCEIAGTCYQQHKKQVPQPPRFLTSTKAFSVSKNQKTTYALYSTALRGLFGPDRSRWPESNRLYLDYLQMAETQEQDHLVKRDYIERNELQCSNEYKKILVEVSEMLNPDLPLYPNPTRDCSWDCPFNVACINLDSGMDWEHDLTSKMIQRNDPITSWRDFL